MAQISQDAEIEIVSETKSEIKSIINQRNYTLSLSLYRLNPGISVQGGAKLKHLARASIFASRALLGEMYHKKTKQRCSRDLRPTSRSSRVGSTRDAIAITVTQSIRQSKKRVIPLPRRQTCPSDSKPAAAPSRKP
jgi:hypothetical protein